MSYVTNAAGREVITEINGEKAIPYKGVGMFSPAGRRFGPPVPSCSDYPPDGNKVAKSLRDALERSGLRDGMTISTHHHFRNGDHLANMVFDIAHDMGIKGLRWFPSAAFPCHSHLIPYLEDGTIQRIEGSMNGPLGKFVSEGRMQGMGVLRSHGGRYQAIQDGEVQIDIAVIGAPTADPFGNAHALSGNSALWPQTIWSPFPASPGRYRGIMWIMWRWWMYWVTPPALYPVPPRSPGRPTGCFWPK
jgi:citrate lyase subunit alpha/citrate CoA-transferase